MNLSQLKIPSFLKNKYALTGAVFLIWITFFDENNLITQYQYHAELNKLEDEEVFYKEELVKIQANLKELKTNPKTLEKFARENYLMKKDDEELFVIVEEE
jgi:cell division protein DivIC